MFPSTYELTNAFYGLSAPLALNTSSSGNELYAGDSNSALIWTFAPAPDDKYYICTTYNGAAFCLDIVATQHGTCPRDCTVPHLASPGDYSGQQWTLTKEKGGYRKLSNDFTGSGWYLDTFNDASREAAMTHGDFQGQYWSINVVNQGSSSSIAPQSSSVSLSTPLHKTSDGAGTTSTATTSTHSRSPTSHPNKTTQSLGAKHTMSSGLSTGAKAGIGVGVGIVVVAIILLGIVFMVSRKRRKRREAERGATTGLATETTGRTIPSHGVPDKQLANELQGSHDEGRVQVRELEGRRAGYHPGLSELSSP